MAIPLTALHREAKNQMDARNKEKGEHLIFSQGYSEALGMASAGNYSAKLWINGSEVSPTPLLFLFFPKDATHSTAALVHVILLTLET